MVAVFVGVRPQSHNSSCLSLDDYAKNRRWFFYEHTRIYDVVIIAPGYETEYRVDSSLPKIEREQAIVKFVDQHPVKKHKYMLGIVNPDTGKPYEIESGLVLTAADLETIRKSVGPDCIKKGIFDKAACEGKGRVPPWDLPWVEMSPKNGLTQIGQFLEGDSLRGENRQFLELLRANALLTLKKRSLIGYVSAVAISPSQYYAFVVIYPLFLFLRSILWAIRKVKE